MDQNKSFNNNILTSEESILYIDNIDVIENNDIPYLKPNSLVVTSYVYDIMKNYHYHKGTSYEMIYIDNDNKKHILTYWICEGNGLYFDNSYNLYVGIDNKTIKENSNHEVYIDSSDLTCAYNDITKGTLCGENKIFYDHALNKSGFTTSEDGIVKVNNGLMMSMYEIQNYYNDFEVLSLNINKMAISLNKDIEIFEVGDILYIDSNGKYTKKADNNMPYMVCVIASNTLSDKCPRFIPLKYNTIQNIFAKNSNSIYYKNLYSYIPIYENPLNKLVNDSSIASSTYGFIATDNSYWKENFKNPFNFNEYYYAGQYTITNDIVWYLDPDRIHSKCMYSIDTNSIVTEIFDLKKDDKNSEINSVIEVKFSDGFIGYYLLTLLYNRNNKRYELKEISDPDIHSILPINRLNNVDNVELPSKIKISNENTLNSNEIENKYQLYSDNSDTSNKFNSTSLSDIDYKILANENNNDISYSINNGNSATLLRRYSNTNETNNEYYTYKLIIDPYICDIDKVYFKVQLGDSSNNISNIMYIEYNNSQKLEHTFNEYYSTIKTGYIKITAYASSEYYDINPIELGIIKITEYDGKLKCIHLTQAKNSFYFNLKNIIPIEAKIFRINNDVKIKENGVILKSNYYDNLSNTIEYILNLNYSSVITEDYSHLKKEDIVTEKTEIEKDITVNFKIVNRSSKNITFRGDFQLMLANPDDNGYYHGWLGVYNRTDHTYLTDEPFILYSGTSITFNNILLEEHSGRRFVDDENMKKTKYPRNVLLYDMNGTYNTILCENMDSSLYLNDGKTYTIVIPGENDILNEVVVKYMIIPGAIEIYIKNSFETLFNERKYYVYLNIRNIYGDSTTGKYEFIKNNNILVLNENISIYDIEGINQISIYKIENIEGKFININLQEIGKVINRTINWENLN